MFQKFLYQCTEKVIQALNIGTLELVNLRQDIFTSEFLLLGLTQQEDSVVLAVADELKMDRAKLKNQLLDRIYERQTLAAKVEGGANISIKISPEMEALFEQAEAISNLLEDKYISAGSIFLALLQTDNEVLSYVFAESGLTVDRVRDALRGRARRAS